MQARMLMLMTLLVLPAEAALYRWVDANGKVHYSDKKPPQQSQKSDQLEMRRSGLVLKTNETEEEPANAVKTLKVEPSPSDKQKPFKVVKTRTITQPEQQAEAQQAAEAEAKRLAQIEVEKAAKAEAERLAQLEAKKAAREEAERLAQIEAEKAARAEAERLAQIEAEKAAKAEAERLAQIEAEKAAKAEAERLAKVEAEQQRQARAAEELRIAKARAEAEQQAAADLRQAREEMMALLERAREAEAKALEAARIATEKLEAAQRQQQLFDNSYVEKPALAPAKEQPLPIPAEVATATPVPAESQQPVTAVTDKAQAVTKKPLSQPAQVAKSGNRTPLAVDDGLNCKVAANNAKTSLQKMISVNQKNFQKGYIPKKNFQTLNQALQEIGWRLTEKECQRSRGEVRAFFSCMSDDVSHLSDCGKKHNFGTL